MYSVIFHGAFRSVSFHADDTILYTICLDKDMLEIKINML